MSKKVLIGGAWPYANYLMHIGHLAALLPGDIIARYERSIGSEVIFVSGTDAHGTPITERAKKEHKSPKEIATFYHEEFVKSLDAMNFSYDLYTTTMSDEHKKQVQIYFKQIMANGYIYQKEELEDFCGHCNKYLSDRELVGECPNCGGNSTGEQCDDCLMTVDPKDLKNKHCKTCSNPTTLKTNSHLYFKLSAFQKDLESYITSHESDWRNQAIGESRKFLNMGLIDRAATRQLDWGIEVPVDGFDDKRIYVWIEAVMGYLTAGKLVAEQRGINFDEFMTADNLETYYIHGKDNIPFHTIIFPALILALKNNYQLPKHIICSEYMNMNAEKMSKSKGNLITVNELVEKYPVDSIRYYMIANGPEKRDTSFSYEEFEQAHDKFLVGVLGNFINRNLSFINKKFEGVITEGKIDLNIQNNTKELYNSVGKLISKGDLKEALEKVFEYISMGNKYYDEQQPWIKVKEDINTFNDITYTCVYMMANIANLLKPFMPETTTKINNFLNLGDGVWQEIIINGNLQIKNLDLLFSRINEKQH